MTKEHLINYIKKQISKGFNINQIKNAALQSGWPEATVNEAIKIATQKPKKSKSKLLFIIPLISLILIGSVLGYLIFLEDILNNSKNQELNNLNEELNNINEIDNKEEIKINECYDINCFINYALNCEKVKMTLTEEIIDFFKTRATMHYEILGEENNKCLLYFKNHNLELEFEESASEEEINFIKSMVEEGFEGTCKFSREKFDKIIEDLEFGDPLLYFVEEPECESTINNIEINDTINLFEGNIQMMSLRKGTTMNLQEFSFMYKENTNEGYLIEVKIDNCFEEILLIDEYEFKCENKYKKIILNNDLSDDDMLTFTLIPST